MKNIKKLLSILLICFLFIVLVPAYVMGCSEIPADIKWTFQNGAAPEGYNTNYLKGCSTTNVYNNMSTYAPGGGYQGATDIWAVYDVPVSVSGTYKLYVNFGSSSMGETDISKALGADFTVTVGGMWDSQIQSYTGGTVAFANHEVKGGLWATKSNEDTNCKSVEVGYLTLTKGTNTIKLDIKSSNSFRIASQSFRLEYCVTPDIKWTFQNGSSLEGYNTNYLKGYSTTNEFNMSTYAPGGGYKGATDIWAVYEIPVVTPGTYKFYAKFGSSNSMTPANMSEAQPADFTVTVGGTWDSDTYTGGNVAFSNSGVIGGIWGTLATAEINCKSVALGYITLDEGINTIKLDIKSSTHFRIASQSFKLEYCDAPQYSNCTVDGNNVQNNELPLNADNITINYTEDVVLDDAVCSFKDGKNNDIFIDFKKTTLDKKVIVSIREPLNAEETYTLSVSGIKAPDGTSVDDFVQEFTVDGDTVLASEQTIEMREPKLEGDTITVLGIVKNSLGDLYKGKSVTISIREPNSYTYETTDIYDISDGSGSVTLLYTIPDGKHRGEYGVKLVMGDTESAGQIVDTTPDDIKWTFQNGNSSSY
ncbi:MAG: hypothetical protein IJA19_04650, partial [Clostridia bacterium]|nr:hypothetical protein [Clostridia bacterium]